MTQPVPSPSLAPSTKPFYTAQCSAQKEGHQWPLRDLESKPKFPECVLLVPPGPHRIYQNMSAEHSSQLEHVSDAGSCSQVPSGLPTCLWLTFAQFIFVNPSKCAHCLKQPQAGSGQAPEQKQGVHTQHRQLHTWVGRKVLPGLHVQPVPPPSIAVTAVLQSSFFS